MNKKPEEVLKEIEALQAKMKACKNDKQAIELQKKAVDILLKTFKNQDLIKRVIEERHKPKR